MRPTQRSHRLFGCLFTVALSAWIHGTTAADDLPDPPDGVISWIPQPFGQAELTYEHTQDLDLDSSVGDDSDSLQAEFVAGLFFQPSRYLSANFETKLTLLEELRNEDPGEGSSVQLEIEEAYVRLAEPDQGLALQVGRQSFEDDRRWLYDARFDAARGSYEADGLSVNLIASHKAVTDESSEDRRHYILDLAHKVDEQVTVGGFATLIDDTNSGDDRLLILGIRSFGTIDDRLTFWFDAAHVRGRESGNDVQGTGFDILGTFRFDAPLSPYAIFGFAFGSGDAEPDEDGDRAFRQTGLQENEVEIGGLVPVKYYGETFDPELNNLTILTAGLGVRPLDDLTIDALFHHYRQNKALDVLRDSGIDAEPNGQDRGLGNEVDLVLGYTGIESVEVRGAIGYFMPGNAFGSDADDAISAFIEILYEF